MATKGEQVLDPSPVAQPEGADKRLGELLIEAGRLDWASLERAFRLQREQDAREGIRVRQRIGSILVQLGLVSERDVVEGLSLQLGLPIVDRKDYVLVAAEEGALSWRFLKENRAMLVAEDEAQVTVAMADPLDDYVRNAIRLATGKRVAVRLGVPSEIEDALEQQRRDRAEKAGETGGEGAVEATFQDDVEHLKELATEAPVIKQVNLLVQRAIESNASDIHVEPLESRLKVRYRIDGLLREVDTPKGLSAAAVISRIKLVSNLNIAERRLPQDGRFKVRIAGKDYDMRVSTVPTMHGESVVMRILQREAVALDFSALGFTPAIEKRLLELLSLPHGILLVTGPTGSGKTTTLYAALGHLNRPERKIITVEDPVEYHLEGVNQIQAKAQIGLTFASALRSIVRQDPDVVMIGEMRDTETAKIAVQSALTGHLVLSTLHTNDAPGSITRLLDMGVEGYLLTSTVNAVLAQRLVRRLCEACREPYEPEPAFVARWRLERFFDTGTTTLHRAKGCERCSGTGYAGRIAVGELLVMSEAVRRRVLEHSDAGAIARAASAEGMVSMLDDGLRKVVEGLTTPEEVLRVTEDV